MNKEKYLKHLDWVYTYYMKSCELYKKENNEVLYRSFDGMAFAIKYLMWEIERGDFDDNHSN